MSALRTRLHEELQKSSEGYRNLPPTEQDRQLDEAVAELLEKHYDELREIVRGRLTRMPPGPGAKGDSWSW
jgi:hypothetical protein